MTSSKLPITVVVPHMESRRPFLDATVMPSIVRNNPAQILVIPGESSAQHKRNEGARQATQPFLFFNDDDCEELDNCLGRMLELLEARPDCGFCYCDFERVIHPGIEFPYPNGLYVVGHDAVKRLRRESPICTMSLIRREAFPGFDEAIKREQDRDLFLAITRAGWGGVYTASPLIRLHQIDQVSITQTVDQWVWHTYINKKYGFVR